MEPRSTAERRSWLVQDPVPALPEARRMQVPSPELEHVVLAGVHYLVWRSPDGRTIYWRE